MIEYLLKDSLFYVIPEDIDHAGAYLIEKVDDEYITLCTQSERFYKQNEIVEVFVNARNGILYFKTRIENYNNNLLTISMPKEYELLQRRESQRILINTPIIVKNDNIEEKGVAIDLSAGGMKIITDKQIPLNVQYNTILDLDNLHLNIIYLPQRLSLIKNTNEEIFSISGQIITRTPNDKIELAQYCYKKSFEQSNRE